jgi:hypothetical protein
MGTLVWRSGPSHEGLQISCFRARSISGTYRLINFSAGSFNLHVTNLIFDSHTLHLLNRAICNDLCQFSLNLLHDPVAISATRKPAAVTLVEKEAAV